MIMGRLKKILWVAITGVSGGLLTLAGYDLVELSSDLIRYTGLTLLGLALVFMVWPAGRKKKEVE